MLKKHGFKILIIAGILMIAAYVGYELITYPWVFGTDEEINARVLPDPTMPPGVNVIISTPPPDYRNSLENDSIFTQNGVGQIKSRLYSSGSPLGSFFNDIWFMPEEETPLSSAPVVREMTEGDDIWLLPEPGEEPGQAEVQDQIEAQPIEQPIEQPTEQTGFAEDAMIQMMQYIC